MKKQISSLLLIVALCMTGCGTANNDSKDNNQTQAPTTTESAVQTAAPDTKATEKVAEFKTDDVKITTADEALAHLKDGNNRFVEDKSELINVTSERRNQLKDGQSPYAVVVSCSDSRVTPSTIFNAGLGEIFDIRIAGNVVDKDALGSIEYGVEHLHCPLLIIMGHEKCGAVTAAYNKLKNGEKVEGNINSLVDKITPAIKDAENINEAIHENIDQVAEQVEKDAIVKHLVEEGKLKVVKAYYSLDGSITWDED
ncbi:MAG: carbonic anhydrase [bacterium]|nr:carbonic anhydrase [bacterium]